MANIDLIVTLDHDDPNYVDSTVRYARTDNTPSPVYTTISGVTTSPLIISNLPNGVYSVFAKPNFTDQRNCPEVGSTTSSCTGITSLSAAFNDPNIVVSFTCDVAVPRVKINISYPNGGFSSQIVDNGTSPVSILAPTDVFGTFLITVQPVCDEDSGFFGVATAPVSVEIPTPSP